MSALMLHDRDPNSIQTNLSKVNHVWKAPHQRSTDIPGNDHPPTGCRSDPKHLPLELIDELSS
jgi:hypothetical protein